jgi:hypothetical protein
MRAEIVFLSGGHPAHPVAVTARVACPQTLAGASIEGLPLPLMNNVLVVYWQFFCLVDSPLRQPGNTKTVKVTCFCPAHHSGVFIILFPPEDIELSLFLGECLTAEFTLEC